MRNVVVLLVWAGLGVRATADLPQEQGQALIRAFEVLHAAEDLAAGGQAAEIIQSRAISDRDWQSFFAESFPHEWFTPSLVRFWEYAAAHSQTQESRVLAISGYCAGTALIRAVAERGFESVPELGGPVGLALTWLARIAPLLDSGAREQVLTAIETTMSKTGSSLIPGPLATPAGNRRVLQIALTLGRYGADSPSARATVSRLLQLGEAHRAFWEAHGVFLFDNGALEPRQLRSLDTLLSTIPPELHEIVAIVAPETTGIDPRLPVPDAPGQVVFIPPIPMERMTDPREFIWTGARPVAPQFTAIAAQQMVRAIQATQFSRRPELAVRRDLILRHAKNLKESYLRHTVAPAYYRQFPDELVPAVAYLWFIDAGATFEMARDLLEIGLQDAMDLFLFMADFFSGGSQTTLFFATDREGRVTRFEAPVSRTSIPAPVGVPEIWEYVTGVSIGGRQWAFELSQMGRTMRWGSR